MSSQTSQLTEAGGYAIELDGVTKVYGEDVVAVDDVSLDIEQGEFFTLIGPSGSGKSTLLQIVAGFVAPTEGRVRLNGVDVTDAPPQDRPTSMVFQEYALFPHMTVEANVRYGLEITDRSAEERDALVTKYLEMLQISDLRERMPAQLSGGQRQRVALARSLVIEPEILLLDEPLGPLDEKLRRHMQFELSDLQDRLDVTFVYITHDQEEALTMSDRMGLLDGGRLVEVGPPSETYRRPRTRFTADFLGAGNILDGTVSAVDGERVTIDTRHGPVVGETELDDLEPGDPVAATVRPQFVHHDREDLENSIRGTVSTGVYKGESYEYLVETDDGTELKFTTDEPLEATKGDPVTLSWSHENCVVVASEEL